MHRSNLSATSILLAGSEFIVTKADLKTRPEAAIATADSWIIIRPVHKTPILKASSSYLVVLNDWRVCIALIIAKDCLSSGISSLNYLPAGSVRLVSSVIAPASTCSLNPQSPPDIQSIWKVQKHTLDYHASIFSRTKMLPTFGPW